MARYKDREWNLPDPKENGIWTWQHIEIAVAMDIRDELKKLNALLSCHNFVAIPHTLKGIRAKLPTKRRKKRKK